MGRDGDDVRQFESYIYDYREALVYWNSFVSNVVSGPANEIRYPVRFLGRNYFVSFQWVPRDSCGYIYYGVVENAGKSNETDVVKKTLKMTEGGRIEIERGSITASNESATKDLHALCIMQMDEEVCKGLPRP